MLVKSKKIYRVKVREIREGCISQGPQGLIIFERSPTPKCKYCKWNSLWGYECLRFSVEMYIGCIMKEMYIKTACLNVVDVYLSEEKIIRYRLKSIIRYGQKE